MEGTKTTPVEAVNGATGEKAADTAHAAENGTGKGTGNPDDAKGAEDVVPGAPTNDAAAVIALLQELTGRELNYYYSQVNAFEPEIFNIVDQIKKDIEKLKEIDQSTAESMLVELYNVALFCINYQTISLKRGQRLIDFYQGLQQVCATLGELGTNELKATHQGEESFSITLKDLKELIGKEIQKHKDGMTAISAEISELNNNLTALEDVLKTVKNNLDSINPSFSEQDFEKLTSCLRTLESLKALGYQDPESAKKVQSTVTTLHNINNEIEQKKIIPKTTEGYDKLIAFYNQQLRFIGKLQAKGFNVDLQGTTLDTIITQVGDQVGDAQRQQAALAQEEEDRKNAVGRIDNLSDSAVTAQAAPTVGTDNAKKDPDQDMGQQSSTYRSTTPTHVTHTQQPADQGMDQQPSTHRSSTPTLVTHTQQPADQDMGQQSSIHRSTRSTTPPPVTLTQQPRSRKLLYAYGALACAAGTISLAIALMSLKKSGVIEFSKDLLTQLKKWNNLKDASVNLAIMLFSLLVVATIALVGLYFFKKENGISGTHQGAQEPQVEPNNVSSAGTGVNSGPEAAPSTGAIPLGAPPSTLDAVAAEVVAVGKEEARTALPA